MNNYLKFSKNCQDTYSSELELKREITSSSEVSLLDLPLKIKKNNLRLSYLIRETNFPFQQFLCPLCAVIFQQIFTMQLQVLRLNRSKSDNSTFIKPANQLLKRMQKQSSRHISIISLLKEIFGKHFSVFHVFADTADKFTKPFTLH